MNRTRENPYTALKRVFHEPSRMAIMSALCGSDEGLAFSELKEEIGLTDGNLNRHLKSLADAGAVTVRKTIVQDRPCTMVWITDLGREGFIDYLKALEEVLFKAAEALEPEEKVASLAAFWQSRARVE